MSPKLYKISISNFELILGSLSNQASSAVPKCISACLGCLYKNRDNELAVVWNYLEPFKKLAFKSINTKLLSLSNG